MDHFQAMRVFNAVVEEGSFSVAATRLGMTKGSVSKYMTGLEEHLDGRLLNRTTRSISLTEIGQRYYDYSQRIIDEVAEAEHVVTQLNVEPRGRLRVNAPFGFTISHMGGCIAECAKRYPQLEIDMHLDDRRVDVVNDGFDVVIRIAHEMPDSSLIAKKLFDLSMVVAASPEYLERHGTPTHPRELKDHNCLVYSNVPAEWYMGDEFYPVQGNVHANSGTLLYDLAKQGTGIIMSPLFQVGCGIKAGALVPILTEYPLRKVTAYAVYPERKYLPLKVKLFIAVMEEYFGKTPDWEDACASYKR